MSSQVSQLLNSAAPEVEDHAPPQDEPHECSQFADVTMCSNPKKLSILAFFALTSVLLRPGSLLHSVCLTLYITSVFFLDINFYNKLFNISSYLFLLLARCVPPAAVPTHETAFRNAIIRVLFRSATVGMILEFFIEMIVQTVADVAVRVLHIAVLTYQLFERIELANLSGQSFGQTDADALAENIRKTNNAFMQSERCSRVLFFVSESVSFAIIPILTISGYSEFVQNEEGERTSTLVLIWAFATGVGRQISKFELSDVLDYKDPGATSLLEVWISMVSKIILVMFNVGAFLYVGAVRAGVGTCFKYKTWASVIRYLFGFRITLHFLVDSALKLNKKEDATRVRSWLAAALAGLIVVVRIAFIWSTCQVLWTTGVWSNAQ